MVNRSKQDWTVGREVRVGFMRLRIIAAIPTPGDWLPDAYAMQGANGAYYRFVPHNGLVKCASLREAVDG